MGRGRNLPKLLRHVLKLEENKIRHVLQLEENEIKCINLNNLSGKFSYVIVDTSLTRYFQICPNASVTYDWCAVHYQAKQVSLQVLDMVNDPHYLYRMTILHAISLLAPVLGSEITSTNLLPLVVNAAKDR